MAAGKTVVRIRLASAELTKALTARGVRNFAGELQGTLLQNGETKDTFKYPVSGTLGGGASFTYSFLRALKPGNYHLKLVFTDPGGGHVMGDGDAELTVLEVSGEFRPEMAPADASTLPDAEGIVIADEAAAAGGPSTPTGGPLLEVPPPIRTVEFYLDDKLLVARPRPPYSVEIDLGNVPRRQTLRAVGYDDFG